jgi:predicted site-specific integrase-resolvase
MPEYTVREYADKERVTPRTVFTWILKGAVNIRRTPSGRIRIIDPPPTTMKFEEERGSSSR